MYNTGARTTYPNRICNKTTAPHGIMPDAGATACERHDATDSRLAQPSYISSDRNAQND